jgi:valyl-tRNA synthetase
LNDLERESEFLTLSFRLDDGGRLPIATTRPELLPACVAVFVHPDDERYRGLIGRRARVPIFGQSVPILADAAAEPDKGSGAVMCCTFGDVVDVGWWYAHNLPLHEVIDRSGRLTAQAGRFGGLSVVEARRQIGDALREHGLLKDRQPIVQSVRVHERCDTPVEYIVAPQWFIRVLDFKQQWLEAGERITWHPEHMKARYREWVENLRWDWCISRQRYFGVPFPLWTCDQCGEVLLDEEKALPVNPVRHTPPGSCPVCGGTAFTPERDVMDTWATSSLTPQLAGGWPWDRALYERVFPMSLRTQAHEIIRTWAFYTIVKSLHHFGVLPWQEIAISGWAIAAEGAGKISKSRGGGPLAPLALIEKYSADAVRYWAASTGFGKDALISEEKMQAGAKLVTKLWNVARFAERFLTTDDRRPMTDGDDSLFVIRHSSLSPADRWILSRTQRLIRRVTELFEGYEYALAKSETEAFFWHDLADNYLEMAKLRLYGGGEAARGPRYALDHVLLVVLKLFAPILPYVTEEIYQALFAAADGGGSLHRARWPQPDEALEDALAERAGEALLQIATALRRYKSERHLAMDAELGRLQIAVESSDLAAMLHAAEVDIMSVTRARQIEVTQQLDPILDVLGADERLALAVIR